MSFQIDRALEGESKYDFIVHPEVVKFIKGHKKKPSQGWYFHI